MTNISDEEMEAYHRYSNARLTQVGLDIMTLSDAERSEFFQMLTDHSAVLFKVFPGLNVIAAAHKQPVSTDTDVVKAYRAWEAAKGH
jgi:hypothetical protein